MEVNMENSLDGAWNLVSERLVGWYEMTLKNLPNFIVAVIVVVVFALLARWISRAIKTIISKSIKNKALTSLAETIAKLVVMATGIFIALGILHLDKTVTSLLAGAGVVGLALGFAFQEIASNFVSGILIAFRQPYRIGDIVTVEGYTGTVKKINLRTTLIETFQGIEVYIPNQYMITKPLQNVSGTPRRRMDLEVGVSYAEDLRKVTDLIKKSLESVQGRINERPVEVFFKTFGGSSINCDVRVWVKYTDHKTYLEARHDVIIRIKEAFDENEITIPFPIRTLDFGIKGGQPLAEPLQEVMQARQAN